MKARELIGYLMGLILFVILIPLIKWKFSGEVHPNAARLSCLGVFAAYFAIMMIQVKREEERLKQDFGEAYEEYCKKTSKLITHIW